MAVPEELVELGRALAAPPLQSVILAEGNVSSISQNGAFWVKGSGVQMASAGAEGYVEVDSEPLLRALDQAPESEGAVRELLDAARLDFSAPCRPSTEAFMHAYLLGLPNVRFVAHSHPAPVISLVSVEGAQELVGRRLFPDEIVLCGAATAWVPYVAPGLPLAREIRRSVQAFSEFYWLPPKTLWLQNHGLITVGQTAAEALSATLMAVKAAQILLNALQTGKPIRFMSDEEVQQIAHWPDEHYRQRLLWQKD